MKKRALDLGAAAADAGPMSAVEPPPSAAAPPAAPQPPPPFRVDAASPPPTPLVFASPHSGRIYPPELLAAARLDAEAIRASEDAWVDRLIADAPAAGAALIACELARAWVDVNRDPRELDPRLIRDPLPPGSRPGTPRVAAGLGAVARVVGAGQEIYRARLSLAEAQARLAAGHAPYHEALAGLMAAARDRFGVAVLVDWHSMPAAAADAEGRRSGRRPDVVLGDRHGAACGPALTAAVRQGFEAAGYVVALNRPYAGGWTTQRWGRPHEGLHAVQVELDRGLYLAPGRPEPGPRFEQVRADLAGIAASLAAIDWPRALGGG